MSETLNGYTSGSLRSLPPAYSANAPTEDTSAMEETSPNETSVKTENEEENEGHGVVNPAFNTEHHI